MTRVVCNPLDLAYRYQDVRTPFAGRSVHREAADPTVVFYRDRYYMFASMTRGFWYSDDLVEWTLRPSEKIPAIDYAPDVREVDGREAREVVAVGVEGLCEHRRADRVDALRGDLDGSGAHERLHGSVGQ